MYLGLSYHSATGNSSFRVQFLAEENPKISTPTNLQFDNINTLLSLENETPTLKFQFPGLV